MRVRLSLALVVALAAAACGGHSSPTQPSTGSPGTSLAAGSYLLTITISPAGQPVCTPSTGCVSFGVCIGTPSGQTTVSAFVHVERNGDTLRIVPDDARATFTMELHETAASLGGTARGTVIDSSGSSLTVNGQGGLQTDAGVAGTIASGRANGTIDGQVGIAFYSCSNNGHSWTLTPR